MSENYELLIRAFGPDDAPATAEVIRTTLFTSNAPDYEQHTLEQLAEWYGPEGLTSRIGHARRVVAVVSGGDLDEPEVIGTAARHENKIEGVFVDPDWQGCGVGAQMLARIEEDARAAGLRAVFVESSVTAQGFYAALDYTACGEAVDLGAGPAVPMRKQLA